MQWKPLIVAAVVHLISTATAGAAGPDAARDLAPTGTLRIGVAYAPAPTPVFAVKSAAGAVRGVPRVLGEALAGRLGLPSTVTAVATTNELTESCAGGTIDIGFMPVDEARRERLDFSPPYFVIESTYLTTAASGITTREGVDRAEVTVVGIEGSTTLRAAGRSLTAARLVAAKSVADAVAMLKAGQAQAIALTHDSLPALRAELPGSRILDGAFQVTGVAIAVPKNHPAALAAVTDFVIAAKQDGTLRRIFDEAGLSGLAVAP
ncbi:MAG: transporter substrate-binding domain-containing protein [Xanthobacteraceae bacterium]|nr:transporter substrate-binding domain-containing protein [Xanthobacteraceae bacterium]